MRLRMTVILCLFIIPIKLQARIYPQAGIETYFGSNKLVNLTPWAGIRVPISSDASLLFKYYNHNISFKYLNNENEEKKRVAHLSNLTIALYAQKFGHDFYCAFSFFSGTDSYRASVLDVGTELRITKKFSVDAGIYLLKESSILWYPDERERDISLNSLKGGLKFKVNNQLSICSRIYLYKNSEDVSATSYSVGLIFVPKEPFCLTLYYFKYSESAQYRFSGDYISIGLNLYY